VRPVAVHVAVAEWGAAVREQKRNLHGGQCYDSLNTVPAA
jgi:hypothetical protein